MKTHAPIPILRSFDETRAREFYLGFLGFEVVFEHRFDADAPLYLGLRMGDCVVHLSEHYGDASPGAALRIEVDDVDAYCHLLNAKGYRNARPGVTEQPWGSRDMAISDPFGNRLVFCTTLA
jgi:uncharacterized glyoxalase superfamily protein PhnB